MSSYKLIRYAGGCGGERISSIAAHYSDVNSNQYVKSVTENRIYYGDLFNSVFTCSSINLQLATDLNIPFKSWHEYNTDEIKKVVDFYKNKFPHMRVGKSHFICNNTVQHRTAFECFDTLNIRPSFNKYWIITALQLYKAGCNVHTQLSDVNNYKNDKNYHTILTHYNKYGWIPEYWAWYGMMSWEEFIDIACNSIPATGNNYEDYYNDSNADYIIDGHILTTDINLTQIGTLYKFLEIEKFRDDHIELLTKWVNGNLQILDKLNLLLYLNKSLSTNKQIELLKSTFTPLYSLVLDRASAHINTVCL